MTPEEKLMEGGRIAHSMLLTVLTAKFMAEGQSVTKSSRWLRGLLKFMLEQEPFAGWQSSDPDMLAAINATLQRILSEAEDIASARPDNRH